MKGMDWFETVRTGSKALPEEALIAKLWHLAGLACIPLSLFLSLSLHQSQLSAHEDIVRTMAVADRYVVSGSGSNDGYAAVWRTL